MKREVYPKKAKAFLDVKNQKINRFLNMAKKKKDDDRKTVVIERYIDPTVSAVLNFIIWGAGYLYNGKRILFGLGLLIAMILMHSVIFVVGIRWFISIQGLIIILSHFVFSLVFAYDAYVDAKEL